MGLITDVQNPRPQVESQLVGQVYLLGHINQFVGVNDAGGSGVEMSAGGNC